jgi:rhomboid family protein
MIPLCDHNRTRTFPFVTLLLIAANSLVFGHELSLTDAQFIHFIQSYGAIPYEILHSVDLDPKIDQPVYVTLLTSMFMHDGWLHILGNMLYLLIFGNDIEDRSGTSASCCSIGSGACLRRSSRPLPT